MTLQVSTGFKSRILGPHSFESIFNGGAIAIYTGAQPANADGAATGTLLGYFTDSGLTWNAGSTLNGLTWHRTDAFAYKPMAQTWACTPVAAGLGGWFRILPVAGDVPALSLTLPRIDGAIGASGSDIQLRLLNPTFAVGVVKYIEQLSYTIPPLPGA